MVTAGVLVTSVPLAVVATLALLAGNRLRSRVDREVYLRWLRRLLFVVGLVLVTQFLTSAAIF